MKPIENLKSLALEYDRAKYPSFPEHARTVPKYTDKTANGLTKCIVDWIKFNGYQAERISSTGRVIDNRETYTNVIGQRVTIGSTKWIPGSSTKGTADISATINGRSIKIEVKIGKDRQSEAQKEYQAAIERAGGVYIIVKNFDEFVSWYDNFISSHT
jgi:hypothetical protein